MTLYNLWKQAKAENALTPLGEKLGADLENMMKAKYFAGLRRRWDSPVWIWQ